MIPQLPRLHDHSENFKESPMYAFVLLAERPFLAEKAKRAGLSACSLRLWVGHPTALWMDFPWLFKFLSPLRLLLCSQ